MVGEQIQCGVQDAVLGGSAPDPAQQAPGAGLLV
jgi:hypothetical protein